MCSSIFEALCAAFITEIFLSLHLNLAWRSLYTWKSILREKIIILILSPLFYALFCIPLDQASRSAFNRRWSSDFDNSTLCLNDDNPLKWIFTQIFSLPVFKFGTRKAASDDRKSSKRFRLADNAKLAWVNWLHARSLLNIKYLHNSKEFDVAAHPSLFGWLKSEVKLSKKKPKAVLASTHESFRRYYLNFAINCLLWSLSLSVSLCGAL